MTIPTVPIGSFPRPLPLLEAMERLDATNPLLDPLYAEAIQDAITQLEAAGSPIVTDGEQRKYHIAPRTESPRKYATGCWRRRDTFPPTSSAPLMTAASHSSATILPPTGKRPLPKSARVEGTALAEALIKGN